jgi:non-ribosomal peptide synthetase component F
LDLHGLAGFIARHQITHILSLPSLYSLLLEETASSHLKSLEVVIAAGEACPPLMVDRHFQLIAPPRLFNEYGPTEGTVWCSVEECRIYEEKSAVPIGRPINNAQIHLLGAQQQLTPIGLQGEIYLGGVGVSRGYLNRAELTAERFIPHPLSDGPGRRLYKTGDLARMNE